MLARYGYYGLPADPELEDLLGLAATLAHATVSVHLLDQQTLHCIATTGLPRDEVPLTRSVAERALQHAELLAIPDLAADPSLALSLETDLGFRFYAAAVLRSPEGEPLGVLSVLDRQSRQLGERLAGHLRTLARQVAAHLELRRLQFGATRLAAPAAGPADSLTHVLLDSISEGLCAMDHGGTITLCNDAFVRLLGFADKSRVLGKHLNEVIAPRRRQNDCGCGAICPIEHAASSGERTRAACEVLIRPDGSVLPVEYRIAPIRENGHLHGAICTFIDISERAREEARRAFMLDLSDRLQRSVDEIDLSLVLSNQFACLADLSRVARGQIEPNGDLVITGEWHSEQFVPTLGRHPLGAWSTRLLDHLAHGAPLALRNSVSDDPAGLTRRFDCAGLLVCGLLDPERSVLLFGCKELRDWHPSDLALVREVIDRVRLASERTRDIRALREAEQRVNLANAIASIGVWEYDPANNTLHWDAQIKAMAHLRPDQPALSVAELLQRMHPQDRETVVRTFQRALAAEHDGELNLDYRIRDLQSGEYLWLTNRGRCITDHRGAKRILGTTREITAERNAADELRRINALLEEQIEERHQAARRQAAYIELGDLLRGQPDSDTIDSEAIRVLGEALDIDRVLLATVDPEGHLVAPRRGWPEPIRRHDPLDVSEYGELCHSLCRGEVIAIEDVRREPALKGHIAWLLRLGWHSLACVPRLEQGRLSAVLILLRRQPYPWPEEDLSFIRDVADRAWTADERIRAEQALAASEEQFRTLADNMSQLAWMADPAGSIYWYNKRWYDYTGTEPQTMRDQGIACVQHPRHRRRVTDTLRRAFGNGIVWEDTHPLRGHDGGYRWFLSRAVPIRDERGKVIHWFGTHTDITAQVAAEDALRELNDSLERRVVERTEELAKANQRLQFEMLERERAEEALRHAQKMEAIGQLTGGLAHDFNNMLTGVLGALDLLQRRLEPRQADLERYIDAAVTSANRAAALTHRLLAFARRQSLDPQPVDVNHLVLSMEDMLRRTIGEHIQLETDLGAECGPAYTDAHQLENALLNLVINARDAMPGGGRLTIATRTQTVLSPAPEGLAPGDYVQLIVRDSGCGMPPEVIDKAFDPFFTTKPIGQGTGLGLSMVYGFARQTGGAVEIDSQPGQGTTVSLLLPRLQATLPAPEPAPASGLIEVPRAQDGESVLVVEDEAAVRMLVVEVLRELGYTALEAVDADSALAIIQSERRVDLLVSDVGLPGLNGRQLAEIARKHRPQLKVLFITGYAPNAELRGEFLDAGMQMLAKPFSIDVLAVRIRQMIEAEAISNL